MSSGPHTPADEQEPVITHETVIDSLAVDTNDDQYIEERHRGGDDEESYRSRRRSQSRSQSHRRERTPHRSRSPRRDRAPRRSRSREGDTYRPLHRRTSYNYSDHYEPQRREKEFERERERARGDSHHDHRDRERERDRRPRTRSRDRLPRTGNLRQERSGYPPSRLTPRETAAIAASQRSQKECRVYVGNLAYEVKWGQLKDFMRQAGEVVFADVLLQPNGMSKGCGVVEFRTPEEARRAIETLNDTLLLGRPIFIREDRETEAKFVNGLNLNAGGGNERRGPIHGRGHNNAGHGGNSGTIGRQIFVGNLPYSVGWQELKDLFRSAGNIIRADILVGQDGRSKGSGTVLFETPRDASQAISMYDGYEWNGRRIEVREDRFAGGPQPPRFAGRPARNFTGSSYGAGSGGGYYGSGAANSYGSSYSPMNAVPEQFDGYGSGGYNEFGAGESMMDFGGGGGGNGFGGYGPYGSGSGYDGSSGFYGSANGGNGSQIFVRNLPFTTTNLDLRDLFKHCGNVMRAEIMEAGGRPKGAGIVSFDSCESARLAVEKFNGYTYGGHPIDVFFD